MTHKKTHRVKRAARSAKTALSSIYKRMALVGKAGMARIKHLRANRSGYDHLAADEEDFAYIEKEAHDILAAISRLRARDAGEYPPEEAFYGPTAPSEAAEFYEPVPETAQEVYEPVPETMRFVTLPDLTLPDRLDDAANMTRGRRRRAVDVAAYGRRLNRAGGGHVLTSPVFLDEIKLNRQGYTSTGRYYGIGGKLFTAYNTPMDFHVELRARDRKDAIAQLMSKYPGISFKRHSKKDWP